MRVRVLWGGGGRHAQGWLGGATVDDGGGGGDIDALVERVLDSGCSEVGRIDAAVALAQLARGGDSEAAALSALLRLFCGEVERGRRGALEGLKRCGAAAVKPLLSVMAAPPNLPSKPVGGSGGSGRGGGGGGGARGSTTELPCHVQVDAAHAVAQALLVAYRSFGAASSIDASGQSSSSAAVLLRSSATVVEAYCSTLQRARSELSSYATARQAVQANSGGGGGGDGNVMQFYPLEKRRLLAEVAAAMGIGHHHADDCSIGTGSAATAAAEISRLCTQCVHALHPLLVLQQDPGAAFSNFMYPSTVQTNAALGLLRLCTVREHGCFTIIMRR
eukprot:COSAG01_NODE_4553_length_4929_cov_16.517805_3_plen_333_part_00